MKKEFIPYEEALALKELGFDEPCLAIYEHKSKKLLPRSNLIPDWFNKIDDNTGFEWKMSAPLYQQAFRWFREKYEFTYSIGKTNIAVIHYGPTTQLLQDNDSYEAAELATIKFFIEIAQTH